MAGPTSNLVPFSLQTVTVSLNATFTYISPEVTTSTKPVELTTTLPATLPASTTISLFVTDQNAAPSTYATALILVAGPVATTIRLPVVGATTLPIITTAPTTALVSPVSTTVSTNSTSTILPTTSSAISSNGTYSSGYNSTTSPAISTDSSNGYSQGTTAGIAIAAAIMGALVAGIVAWLLFRRRNRLHSATAGTSPGKDLMSNGHNSTEMAVVGSAALASLLPVPMEEGAIAREVSRLETIIRNHAHSFYATRSSIAGVSVNEELTGLLGVSSPVSSQQIASFLADHKTRIGAVRFLLAWCILGAIQHDAEPSLLPTGLSQCMKPTETTKDKLELAAKWRQMTGVLLQTSNRERSTISQHSIDNLALDINQVLKFYASPDAEQQRQQNLKEIIRLGAQLGMTLLTQPTTWIFDWDNGRSRQRDELVVFPALVQTGDDKGHVCQRSITYGDRQVVKVEQLT